MKICPQMRHMVVKAAEALHSRAQVSTKLVDGVRDFSQLLHATALATWMAADVDGGSL